MTQTSTSYQLQQRTVSFLFSQTSTMQTSATLSELAAKLRSFMLHRTSKIWYGDVVYTIESIKNSSDTIIIYNIFTEACTKIQVTGYSQQANHIIHLQNGDILCGISHGRACIWNTRSGQCMQSFAAQDQYICYDVFDLTNDEIAVEYLDYIVIYNKYMGSVIKQIIGNKNEKYYFLKMTNGTLLMAHGKNIDTLDRNYNVVSTIQSFEEILYVVEISPNVIQVEGMKIYTWKIGSGTVEYKGTAPHKVAATFLRNGMHAFVNRANEVVVCDQQGNRVLIIPDATRRRVTGREFMGFAEVTPGVIACQHGNNVVLWDITTGKKIQEHELPEFEGSDIHVKCFLFC
jgi:WD40 repeat protein